MPVYTFSGKSASGEKISDERTAESKAAVKSALIYPVSVISIAMLVVGCLLKFVVPIFANLFNGLGVELPLPTRIVMGLSKFVGRFGVPSILLLVGIGFAIRQGRKNPA